jgi:hypothetical protein
MSNASKDPTGVNTAALRQLKARIGDYGHVLDRDTFKARHISNDRDEAVAVINYLKGNQAIKAVDSEDDEVSGKHVNVWTWVNYRAQLQKHWKERETLPCGCRPHVPAEQDDQTYYCKFCGTGHSRDVITEVL